MSRAFALGSLLALVIVPSSASAFCRATTAEPRNNCDCPDGGAPLYWKDTNISYAFNERGFPGLDDETVRWVVGNAFNQWTSVRCDNRNVLLQARALSAPTSLVKGPKETEPNLNVIAHLDEDEWYAEGLDENAFALTTNWYWEDGEIIGSDIRFNGGRGDFTICPDEGCPDGSVDLENVATHEVGHLFGLGHTSVRSTTMWCEANSHETEKRTLEADDERGICSIYAESAVRERNESLAKQQHNASCAVAPNRGGGAAWAALLPLLALLGLGRRSRNRQRG